MGRKNSRFFFSLLIAFAASAALSAATHPVLVSSGRIAQLAAGGAEWNTLKKYCDDNLNKLLAPGYAGWDWRTAVENYSLAYQVTLSTDQVLATKYANKALAIMKVLARHHNYGGVENGQVVGLGDGSTKSFPLPFTPLSGATVTVLTAPVSDTALTYAGASPQVNHFDPVVKISNTANGPANYASTDYKLLYRDGLNIYVLKWLTANHPASGAAYHIFMTSGSGTTIPSTQYSIAGNNVVFTTAPAVNQAVFVRYIGDTYEQTGNFLGGYSTVTPDGPGYQMRTFCVGLAYGYDLLYDFSGFTTPLKAEFTGVLNQEIDWYRSYGYERTGDLGNYFIRGLLTGAMFTAYATDGANSRTAELKLVSDSCIQRTFGKLDVNLPGGYGPQGQYTNGVANDVLQIFTIYQALTGTNLLSTLEWTSNIIPATIYGTKPDRVTFYDGGDWSNLPATPLDALVTAFLTYLPGHAMAPYARQLLNDIGVTNNFTGTVKDYKTDFPLDYLAKTSGPLYARSDWGGSAVWVSFAAGEFFMDHQHYDQGHVTLQRGADYLLVDAGGYGDYTTDKHNTLLFDDRGAGNISTYPPGQGAWGFQDVSIKRYESKPGYAYGLADFTRSYAAAHDGLQNSVKAAIRSVVFLRPGILVVHDRAQTLRTDVKKIFSCNFGNTLTQSGGAWVTTVGASKLYIKSLLPSGPVPTVSPIVGQQLAKSNYQELVTGKANDNFFHVFEAGASALASMTPSLYSDAGSGEGIEIKVVDTTWVVQFSKTDSQLTQALTYRFQGSGPQRHVITDLGGNVKYNVTVKSKGLTIFGDSTHLASAAGVATFAFISTDSGSVTFVPGKVAVETLPARATAGGGKPQVRMDGKTLLVTLNLRQTERVKISLFDCAGRRLMTVADAVLTAGNHTLRRQLDATLPAGIYLLRCNQGSTRWTFKIVKGI